MTAVVVELPDEVVNEIAVRAAEIVVERLRAEASSAPSSPYVTVAEAAEILRTTPGRVHNLLSARQLTAAGRNGRRVLIARADLEAFIAGTTASRVSPEWPHPSQTRSHKRTRSRQKK